MVNTLLTLRARVAGHCRLIGGYARHSTTFAPLQPEMDGSVQDYITVLEDLSEARRREVLALKADSHRSNAELKRLRRKSAEPPPHGEIFCAKETSVLPAKMRAIIEDNRVLKEKARKFRERCTHAQEECSKLSAQNAELQQALREARRQLRDCDVDPDEFAALKVRPRTTCSVPVKHERH